MEQVGTSFITNILTYLPLQASPQQPASSVVLPGQSAPPWKGLGLEHSLLLLLLQSSSQELQPLQSLQPPSTCTLGLNPISLYSSCEHTIILTSQSQTLNWNTGRFHRKYICILHKSLLNYPSTVGCMTTPLPECRGHLHSSTWTYW